MVQGCPHAQLSMDCLTWRIWNSIAGDSFPHNMAICPQADMDQPSVGHVHMGLAVCPADCGSLALGQVGKVLGIAGRCPQCREQGTRGRQETGSLCEALPELHIRLPQNESRSLLSGLPSLPLIWHGLPRMDQQQPFLVGCEALRLCLRNHFRGCWYLVTSL